MSNASTQRDDVDARPIAYTSQRNLDRLRENPSFNSVMWGEPLPHHEDIALYIHPAPSTHVRWLPIALADKTITNVEDFSEVGITLRTSDRYWVRDDDGRIYEAAWSEGDRDYWWDFAGESPVDPVEFMPHPLDPRWVATTETN